MTFHHILYNIIIMYPVEKSAEMNVLHIDDIII